MIYQVPIEQNNLRIKVTKRNDSQFLAVNQPNIYIRITENSRKFI